QTNLVTTDKVADVLPQADVSVPMAQLSPRDLGPKSVQDRFVSHAAETDASYRSGMTGTITLPPRAASLSPRSVRSHPPPHRTSAWSRRAGPCSRAPA